MIERCISAMINAGIAIENKRFCQTAINELSRLSPVAHPKPHPRNHTRALSEARLSRGSSRLKRPLESFSRVAIDILPGRISPLRLNDTDHLRTAKSLEVVLGSFGLTQAMAYRPFAIPSVYFYVTNIVYFGRLVVELGIR